MTEQKHLKTRAATVSTMASDSLHPKTNQPATYLSSGGRPIAKDVGAKVYEIAHNRMETSQAITPLKPIEIMSYADIELGKLLGTGSFSSAFRVKSLQKQRCETLVMKKLRPEVLRNPLVFAACAADLQLEGKILASLDHPNIIHLKAWSGFDMIEKYLKGSHVSAFLILDRLQETLEERIETWIRQKPRFYYSKKRKAQSYRALEQAKSHHALSLVRALDYIHGCRILHRDLKAGMSEWS
jgi:serine/threonine protein kinase